MIFTKFNPQRIENKINRLLRSVGIGSGSSVLESGEEFILDILKKHMWLVPPSGVFGVGVVITTVGGGGAHNPLF